jgi:hypothetical protein
MVRPIESSEQGSNPQVESITDEVLLEQEDPKVQAAFAKEIAAKVIGVYSSRIVAH